MKWNGKQFALSFNELKGACPNETNQKTFIIKFTSRISLPCERSYNVRYSALNSTCPKSDPTLEKTTNREVKFAFFNVQVLYNSGGGCLLVTIAFQLQRFVTNFAKVPKIGNDLA